MWESWCIVTAMARNLRADSFKWVWTVPDHSVSSKNSHMGQTRHRETSIRNKRDKFSIEQTV
jgi:hypothetical protein